MLRRPPRAPPFDDLANLLAMHDNNGMHRKHLLRQPHWGLLIFAAGILFAACPSFAQKADINVNIYEAIPSSTSSSATQLDGRTYPPRQQSADPSLGFWMGGRYIFSPIFGLAVNFGYNRATQHFVGGVTQTGVVYSHAKPFTIDYVATPRHTFFGTKPFFLVGAGFISYNISSFSSIPARPEKDPVFEYGFGTDYSPAKFPPFMAMRFEYRGLVGHAPDYLLPYLSTTNLINIAEPQVGLVFKF